MDMKFCSNCGSQIGDGVKFCPSCGSPVQSSDEENALQSAVDADKHDIEQNKVMGVLAYLGILVLIPLLAAKDSRFARFHTNQGLVLCVAAIIYGVAYSVLSGIILAISWRLYFVVSILGLIGVVFAVLCVIGIINVVNGQMKELPVIGKYRILK